MSNLCYSCGDQLITYRDCKRCCEKYCNDNGNCRCYYNIVDGYEYICVTCINVVFNEKEICEKMVEDLEKENKELIKENEKLKLEIKYRPNGEGYKEAEEHFNSLINKNKDE